jgi:hypothetical protein
MPEMMVALLVTWMFQTQFQTNVNYGPFKTESECMQKRAEVISELRANGVKLHLLGSDGWLIGVTSCIPRAERGD